MIGRRFKDRAQVQTGHTQLIKIRELLHDPPEIPAKEIVVQDPAVYRLPFRTSAPIRTELLARQFHVLSCMIEPVNEDLVINSAIDPLRLLVLHVIDRLLPRYQIIQFRCRVIRFLPADHMEAQICLYFEMIPIQPSLMQGHESGIDPVIAGCGHRRLFFYHQIVDLRTAAIINDNGTGFYHLNS